MQLRTTTKTLDMTFKTTDIDNSRFLQEVREEEGETLQDASKYKLQLTV